VRRVIVIFAVLVFASSAIATLVTIKRHRISDRPLPRVERTVRQTDLGEDFRYHQESQAPKMRTFNLGYTVTLAKDDSRARIFFNFHDLKNHHYVDLRPDRLEIVVVQGEDGIGRVLETVEGLSLPVGKPFRVTVKRRELAVRVVVDEKVIGEAWDETFHSGKVGYASLDDDATFADMTLQSVGEIYFADDFMRTSDEKGVWTELRGKWKVYAQTHASMSANAFQYAARTSSRKKDDPPETAEGAAVTGYPFWDDYSFEVAANPQRPTPFGLYFYYRDENNYFRFEWHADRIVKPETDDKEKEPQQEETVVLGRKLLVRMADGKRTVVVERPGGFKRDHWYSVKCQVSGQRARVFIDENLIFDHRDDRLASGMVGLWVGESSRTFFDDVFVRSHRYFEDGFTNGGTRAWSYMGGRWQRTPLGRAADGGPLSGVLSVETPDGVAHAAIGSAWWKDYVLETEIHPGRTGETGVLLCYQDETRYYEVSCRVDDDQRETWTLTRVVDDRREELDRATLASERGSRKVRAAVDKGYLSVAVNGRRTLEAFDMTLKSGRAGLFASEVASASFGPVKVDWPLEKPPLLTLNEVFEQEISMGNWSSPESEWDFTQSKGRLLHRGHWPGDVRIEIAVNSVGKGEVGLVVSGDEKAPEKGYVLKLITTTVDDKEHRTLQFFRGGKPMDGEVLDVAAGERGPGPAAIVVHGDVSLLGVRRIGDTLIGTVNQQAVLAQRDPKPLDGDVLGWYDTQAKRSSKSELLKSLVTIGAPSVQKYLFRKAHTDWRVVKGAWEITNRWQCDPRWTFMSGRNLGGIAGMWYKRRLAGDTTMDFYVGPKMDSSRGRRYEYAANFNCTLAGNGIDLDSGYGFLFGGFNNTKTVLLRKNKIVAEAKWPVTQGFMRKGEPAVIPSAKLNIHRMWFHVKAQKKGNRLRLWIDDELVIDYTDPQPLTGDRVALWTWKNGIMVARVTVSASQIGRYENPDAYQPARCRCIYDQPDVASR